MNSDWRRDPCPGSRRAPSAVTNWTLPYAGYGTCSVCESNVYFHIKGGVLPHKKSRASEEHDWEPGHWWRAVGPDGLLWDESSSEQEVRKSMRPGDRLQRTWVLHWEEWRDV